MQTTKVEVWAPLAQQLWLHRGDQRVAMRAEKSGWWSSDRLSYEELGDYWLSVDDGPRRPDPRSAWQPFGVNGPSRKVDHLASGWTDGRFQARPLSSAVLYELHIGTFSHAGTFDGAIDHLAHLVDLGITHIELMPIAEFPGQYSWGYDGVCPFAPASQYGGPAALKRLVNACHEHGLAIILDVVYSHLGPVANRLAEFGPYFTDKYHTNSCGVGLRQSLCTAVVPRRRMEHGCSLSLFC